MLWIFNQLENTPEARRLVDYKQACKEKDPFQDTSLLVFSKSDPHEKIIAAVQEMASVTESAGLESEYEDKIQKLLSRNIDIFCSSLSSGLSVNLFPLKRELRANARLLKVKLRHYSKFQKIFLPGFVDQLVQHGLAYSNTLTEWASEPLLILKDKVR